MSMPRCCIIGGGGFIGVNLANHLTDQGWTVRSFGRPPDGDSQVRASDHVAGEFRDAAGLIDAVQGCDIVFHLIGSTPGKVEADRLADLNESVANTVRLLEMGAAGAYGKIVFVSSGGTVYGTPAEIPISEVAQQWPTCSYGVNKMMLERYLHVFEHVHGLRYAVARVSNPYGPYQRYGNGQGVVAALLGCVIEETPFRIIGDGSIVRDYLYVSDLVDALYRLALHDGTETVFNVGSGIGTSLNALIAMIEDVSGRAIDRIHCPARAFDVPVNVLNNARMRALGWQVKTALPTGLARSLHWMREHRSRIASDLA